MPSSPERSERAFAFLKVNQRPGKPRSQGVTEIRGPYYTPMGRHYLQDILETMGSYVDALKFAGGSFALMPKPAVRGLIDLCHAHERESRRTSGPGAPTWWPASSTPWGSRKSSSSRPTRKSLLSAHQMVRAGRHHNGYAVSRK
jgi:(2R)-phospho-3-sulfolactate synthase (ComA)